MVLDLQKKEREAGGAFLYTMAMVSLLFFIQIKLYTIVYIFNDELRGLEAVKVVFCTR